MACRNNPKNIEQFIEKKGLSTIFAFFMHKGLKKKDLVEIEEPLVGLIETMCKVCQGDNIARLLQKFTEKKFEKLERLLEMHCSCLETLEMADERRKEVSYLEVNIILY